MLLLSNLQIFSPANIGELSMVFRCPFDWGVLAVSCESKTF